MLQNSATANSKPVCFGIKKSGFQMSRENISDNKYPDRIQWIKVYKFLSNENYHPLTIMIYSQNQIQNKV